MGLVSIIFRSGIAQSECIMGSVHSDKLTAHCAGKKMLVVAVCFFAIPAGNMSAAFGKAEVYSAISTCAPSKWILVAGSCRPEPLSIFSLDSVGCFRKAEAASAAAMSLILRKDVLIDGVLSSPTWVATNPKLPVFYTADSNLNSSTSLKYSITQSPTGSLEFKASILESCKQAGYRPVCVTVDGDARFLATADYKGGTVTSVGLDSDGALQPHIADVSQHVGQRDDRIFLSFGNVEPQCMGDRRFKVVVGPDGRFVYSCDLGLDKVFQYSIDITTGKLNIVDVLDVEACSGPRRIAFQPVGKGGRFAYVVHEMGNAATPFPINGTGNCNKAAEVRITASATLLFVSNRGHNSIAAFRISDNGARLTLEGWPASVVWPRGFNLTPDSTILVTGSDDMPGYTSSGGDPVAPPGSIVAFAVNETPGHPVLSLLAHAPALGACDVAVLDTSSTA